MIMLTIISVDKNSSKQYKSLLDFITKNSRYVSFHFPNYETNDRIIKINTVQDFISQSDDSYKSYVKQGKKVIDIIKNDIIRVSVAKRYSTLEFGYYSLIFKFKLSNQFFNYLKTYQSLFYWDRDNMLPQDLCFYRPNKKCLISTISHDKIIYLYDATKAELQALKSSRIEYQKIPKLLVRKVKTPTL